MSTLTAQIPRSYMLVSAANKDAIKKFKGSDADGIIIDLEDMVESSDKNNARNHAVQSLKCITESSADTLSKFAIGLRINNLKTGFGGDDFCYCFPYIKPHFSLIYPKVDSVRDIKDLEELLLEQIDLEPSTRLNVPVGLILDIESAKAFVNLKEIVQYTKHESKVFKLNGLIFGSIDYIKSMGRVPKFYDNQYLDIPRYQLAQMAKAYNVLAIDMIEGSTNLIIVQEETIKAYNMGYNSKLSITPEQNIVINAGMMPPQTVVEWANEVKHKFEEAMKNNKDAIEHKGELLIKSTYHQAKAVLEAVHNALEKKQN